MVTIGSAERYGEYYRVIRYYFDGERELVGEYYTLDEAREHCSADEASSRTATSSAAMARTAERGPWFEGYEEAGS